MSDKGKGYLEYILTPQNKAVSFQLVKVHPHLTEYLREANFVSRYGLVIALNDSRGGKGFLEFKQSKNTLFLSSSSGSWTDRIDVTRFPTNTIRDNQIELVKKALQELVMEVKQYSKSKYPEFGAGNHYTIIVE